VRGVVFRKLAVFVWLDVGVVVVAVAVVGVFVDAVVSLRYAGLFAARQEQLRTGQHAQLTVGVGLVCWRTRDGTVVEHPLVQIPVRAAAEKRRRKKKRACGCRQSCEPPRAAVRGWVGA
jgi:hypothetical protein